VLWFAHGRVATREEVEASISSGLPYLEAMAKEDGHAAMKELTQCVKTAQTLLPAA
jgi:hypothetical protein